jgi:hypothetical protein
MMTHFDHIEPTIPGPDRPVPIPPPPAPDVLPEPIRDPARDPTRPEHPDPVREPPQDRPPIVSVRGVSSLRARANPRVARVMGVRQWQA